MHDAHLQLRELRQASRQRTVKHVTMSIQKTHGRQIRCRADVVTVYRCRRRTNGRRKLTSQIVLINPEVVQSSHQMQTIWQQAVELKKQHETEIRTWKTWFKSQNFIRWDRWEEELVNWSVGKTLAEMRLIEDCDQVTNTSVRTRMTD